MKKNTCLFISTMIATALAANIAFSQPTVITFPSHDTLSNLIVKNSSNITLMKLNSDGGFCLYQDAGVIPATGPGSRLMWYPDKSAFRVGTAESDSWDDAQIGPVSVAMGYGNRASGETSTALGFRTTASGSTSTALGFYSTASGHFSTAIGYYASAGQQYSLAMGTNSSASGSSSTAIGSNSTASGTSAIAIGQFVTASGNSSVALGTSLEAKHAGSFMLGDGAFSQIDTSSANYQMTMRFTGGYRIFSNLSLTTGVYMNSEVSGWTNYCDRNKKENFQSIDGEQILMKIREMPITEWNYKGTNKSVKYIGPVAQDFYSAFHLGGTDSLGINSICIDGVNIAAIQALEKRTAELQKANEKIAEHEDKIKLLEKKIEILSNMISSSSTNIK